MVFWEEGKVYWNKMLENGQSIALRVTTGLKEGKFPGVIRSFDHDQGLVWPEIAEQGKDQAGFFAEKEATIVGKNANLDLDLPCVVVEENRFPILVCRKVDRRNYVRVIAFLHLHYRIVERALYESDPEGCLIRIRDEMGNGQSSLETLADEVGAGPQDPKLLCLLVDMNKKLDRILSILKQDRDIQSDGPIKVNISGSGIRFAVREKMEARKLLAIRIVLPLSPPAPVVFLGEITRVRQKENGEFEIAVKYLVIDEMDREQIVRYGFKRMRESIRNRRKKTGQM